MSFSLFLNDASFRVTLVVPVFFQMPYCVFSMVAPSITKLALDVFSTPTFARPVESPVTPILVLSAVLSIVIAPLFQITVPVPIKVPPWISVVLSGTV